MKYELTIALRYLWVARKRAHTAFLSLISALGLGVGVATLLISLALLSGLQGQIRERLIASTPQVLIEPLRGNAIEDSAPIVAMARRLGATKAEAVVSGFAWAAEPESRRGRPVRLRSFEQGNAPAPDQSFGRAWQLDEAEASPIFVTRDFAASVGVFLGDDLVIVAPRMRLTPFGTAPVWRKYRVTRLLPSGSEDKSPEAFLESAEASSLFATGGNPTSIEIFAPLPIAVDIQQKIAAANPNVTVKSWKEINRPLFLALRLEKIVMFATISLIIFVAALNLVSSLSMLIVERRAHVGILRTLGASESSILGIFLGVGLLIGISGTIIGNVVGLSAAWLADTYHLVKLPGEFDLTYIPFKLDLLDVIGVNVIAIALSILSTWYPARIASRLDPIVAIREGA